MRSDTPPEGAKAVTGGISLGGLNVPVGDFTSASAGLNAPVTAFAPSGGVSSPPRPNPGCRSLRSLALGCGLTTPSGFSLNACLPYDQQTPNYGCHSLRSLALGCGLATPPGFSLNACLPYDQQAPNYGCRFAALACPALWACNPSGVFVERLFTLQPTNPNYFSTNPIVQKRKSFGFSFVRLSVCTIFVPKMRLWRNW